MNAINLPELYKLYKFKTKLGSVHIVNGVTKKNILESKNDIIQLADGSCVHRWSIGEFQFEHDQTKSCWLEIPEEERRAIISQHQKVE